MVSRRGFLAAVLGAPIVALRGPSLAVTAVDYAAIYFGRAMTVPAKRSLAYVSDELIRDCAIDVDLAGLIDRAIKSGCLSPSEYPSELKQHLAPEDSHFTAVSNG